MISKTYHRYIWLLDTLLQDGPLTYNEIVQRWESIPGRTDALPLRPLDLAWWITEECHSL